MRQNKFHSTIPYGKYRTRDTKFSSITPATHPCTTCDVYLCDTARYNPPPEYDFGEGESLDAELRMQVVLKANWQLLNNVDLLHLKYGIKAFGCGNYCLIRLNVPTLESYSHQELEFAVHWMLGERDLTPYEGVHFDVDIIEKLLYDRRFE